MHKKYIRARELRKNTTPQEQKLWDILRKKNFHGLKFTRQFQIGNYIVDFVCRSKKIVIEVDGGQHNEESNIKSDKIRTEYLNSKGYKVIRFWNNEIEQNLEGVYERLLNILE